MCPINRRDPHGDDKQGTAKKLINCRKMFYDIFSWGEPKQPMKRQQPRNYDFGVFQFNLLGSQGGNSREMTTSPPGHYWEVTVALTTAAKLQKVRANSREMTSQKLNEEHEILRRFMAVVVSSAFWDSLILSKLQTLAWPSLQSLAVKKKLFFCANFGRWKTF